jgi:KAP-like P-loop domain-containing protein
MSAAAPGGAEPQPLGVVEGVEFAVGRTDEPWTLPIDMLAISASQMGGVGALGAAVRAAMPDLAWDSVDYGSLVPDAPLELPVSDLDRRRAGSQLRSLAVATVRGPAAERGFEGPTTAESAPRATAGVIRLAHANGVGALGLPLLGSESAGLPVIAVADAVVARLVDAVTELDLGGLRHVVLVCRDDATEHAIRRAWERRTAAMLPDTGERLPFLSDAEELLGFAIAVMRARGADRVTAMDVLLAVLVRPTPTTRFRRREVESGSTFALLQDLPGDRDRRVEQALAEAGIETRRLAAAAVADLDVPALADVVAVSGRLARRVGRTKVLPHHIAAAAVGGMLREPAIPSRVLTALGRTQWDLRDTLRDAISRWWPRESAIAWAAEWAAGESALAGLRAASGPQYADVLSDAESAEDRLGITADVNALAALLAATTSPPPLSVALLGDWGSGKSTFMNLVHQRVAALSERAGEDPGSRFSPSIRQVRFNAWHYSDDHVWVGLVEHLFQALQEQAPGRPDREPSVPELEAQLESAERKHARLVGDLERIDELEPDRGWWGWLWQSRRLVLIMRAARRPASDGLTWQSVLAGALWAVAVGVVVVGAVLGSPMVAGLAALPIVAALLTPAVATWRRARDIADAAHTKLVQDRKQLAADIAALEAQLDRADPVRGLKAIVEELNSGDRYQPFRGLTGQIHQDLARLDQQMSKLDDPRTRQRIILYVDDLDRCTSERVVRVLQAVNLLLSMSLFVVVVAVDPRWLLKSLEEHYGKPMDGRVRALDYLDKIFHVPFAIRPMNDRAGDYLRSLLPDVEPVAVRVEQAVPPAPGDEPAPEPQPVDRTGPGSRDAPAPIDEQPIDEHWRPAAPVVDGLTGRPLRIRPVEAAFLPRIATVLDTPRAVKKAVNLYVLLRATIPDADLGTFLGDERGGQFQAAALLIAGIVGCPAEASDLLECVMRAKPDEPIVSVLANGTSSVRARLAELIEGLAEEFPLLGHASAYQLRARTVARYSFESYALFGDGTSGR